jgi:exosortase
VNSVCQWLEAKPRRWQVAGLLVFGALWLALCHQLYVEWQVNAQYSYGWGVPGLSLYLLWLRWRDAPPPTPAPRLPGAGLFGAALALSLLPLRMVQEANPDWRLVSWTYGLVVVALTLLAVEWLGGRAWRRHFWLVGAFILLAVPWPTPLENALTQSLMRGVAAVTVECANWCGIPAVRVGNLIHLTNGIVGIDEACTGVRSFQATLMVAVFLGELYRFKWPRRAGLIITGVALALCLNVVRALLLTALTARRGAAAIAAWHDPAGYMILAAALAGLWALAARLKARSDALDASSPAAPAGRQRADTRQAAVGAGPATAGAHALPPALARPIPARWLVALAAWLVFVEAGTETWFRAHEIGLQQRHAWTLAWPEGDPGFRAGRIPGEVRRLLRYSTGQAANWRRPDGSDWLLYWFRWDPGRASALLARMHAPEICLPAGGLRMVSALGVRPFLWAGETLPFRVYVFESRGRPLIVFYCLWEDRPRAKDPLAGENWLSRRSRWRAVIKGQRHLGQQVLEVAVADAKDLPHAERELHSFLQRALRLQ